MAENSNIEWTDHTFNPWRGCTHATLADGAAHPGCEHCYAETLSKRNPSALGTWGGNGTRVMGTAAYWRQPLKWNRDAEAAGERKRVFCASLADVFEDWQGPILNSKGVTLWRQRGLNHGFDADDGSQDWACGKRHVTMGDLREQLFKLIDSTPWLDWLLLTKRPGNIRRMLVPHCLDKVPGHVSQNEGDGYRLRRRDNIWLLTSVSDQATADALIPELLKCRDLSPVLGISAEPLLGPIDFQRLVYFHEGYSSPAWQADTLGRRWLDWVIVGGESGPGARPMHRQWAISIRDQCATAGVPIFFKQWGEWAPCAPGTPRSVCVDYAGKVATEPQHHGYCPMIRVGKKAAGRLLDAATYDEYPQTKEASV